MSGKSPLRSKSVPFAVSIRAEENLLDAGVRALKDPAAVVGQR